MNVIDKFIRAVSLLLTLITVSSPVYSSGNTDSGFSKWFEPAVAYVTDLGIMKGRGTLGFDPYGYVTRGELAVVLYRMSGETGEYVTPSFKDNKVGAWYFDGVEFCADKAIIKGYTDGRFGVSDTVTREDLMTMLFRYAEYKGLAEDELYDYLATYEDSGAVSSYAVSSVNWCLINGVTDGNGDMLILPKGYTTRAELSQMLMNFSESVMDLSVAKYRVSDTNPYGIAVRGMRQFGDKLTFRICGTDAADGINFTVRFNVGGREYKSETRTLSSANCDVRCVYDTSVFDSSSQVNVGLTLACTAELEITLGDETLLDKTLFCGNRLQKAQNGAKLYYKGEHEMDCRILLYHEFSEKEPVEEWQYSVVTTPENFEGHLKYLEDNGYSIIPLHALIEYNRGERALPARSVVLTLDDGYLSNYTMVYPLLKKYDAPATIFVTLSTMGKSGRLTWDMMREMEASGIVNIASHSWEHNDHQQMTDEEVYEDFKRSFALLDGELGGESYRFFAYPYGRYTAESTEIAKWFEIDMQMTTNWSALDMDDLDLHKMPRLTVAHKYDFQKLLDVDVRHYD